MNAVLLMLKRRRTIVVAVHALIVVISYYTAFLLRFDGSIDKSELQLFIRTLPLVGIIELGIFVPFKLYRELWRYSGIKDLENIIKASAAGTIIAYGLIDWMLQVRGFPRSIYLINGAMLILLLGGARLARRVYHEFGSIEHGRRVLVVGAGDAGEMIVRDMLNNAFYNLDPIGFVDDDPAKLGGTIHAVPVLGALHDLPHIVARRTPDEILLAICRIEPRQLRSILRLLQTCKLPIKMLPNLRELMTCGVTVNQIRNVSLEDLLQRGPVGLDLEPLKRLVEGGRILVTGAGGSIGSELCRQLAGLNAGTLLLFERYENALYAIEAELLDRGLRSKIIPIIGDVTDSVRVRTVFEEYRPQIILHAAAHKHVPLVEQNPCEAVKNNVRGTRIVAETAVRYGAERFILISTDKAVRPSSLMGATKRAAELVVRHLGRQSKGRFAIVRFGNVLGSNGSVVPRFLNQIKAGGPLTVTHPEVERFFMTIPEAVNLVLHAATLNERAAIYALDMGTPIKILEMAQHLIQLSGLIPYEDIGIEFIGLRPGEKLSEVLVDDTEKSEPSEVRQILRIMCPALPNSERLYRELLRLESLAARDQSAEVIALLSRLIPGFSGRDGRPSQEAVTAINPAPSVSA